MPAELITTPYPSEIAAKRAEISDMFTSQLDDQAPDVLLPFSGSITDRRPGSRTETSPNRHLRPLTSGYRSLAYSDLSEHGMVTGGRTRVIAGAEVAKIFPEIPVVTDSFNRFDPTEPTMASVITHELGKRGVNPDRIIQQTKSFSTITQLIETVRLAEELNLKRLAIITNDYHLPRVGAMWERLNTIEIKDPDGSVDTARTDEFQERVYAFSKAGRRVAFVGAESIMRVMHPRYGEYIECVQASDEYQKTVVDETRGVRDLQAGTYRLVFTPENPRT